MFELECRVLTGYSDDKASTPLSPTVHSRVLNYSQQISRGCRKRLIGTLHLEDKGFCSLIAAFNTAELGNVIL